MKFAVYSAIILYGLAKKLSLGYQVQVVLFFTNNASNFHFKILFVEITMKNDKIIQHNILMTTFSMYKHVEIHAYANFFTC